ncbi:nucleotidyltransferase domain-containing protein [Tenacibaculum retecalamus]|uniref:nucleotidyltransferase domain-containing protein n=1 Tax=Tenacibaculum retecalamus TaxID=3018315 RepID=UPI0023D9247B|nr:nucleotidyltransferase domain-containing protein [Tenacibaculum retecalamus]WBX71642.1 nucleotidyltransferase domain-containing protein [Tenacibaculum retecalamus]
MNILKAISYFSIFNYPLTSEEIFKFSDIKGKDKMVKELSSLEQKGVIYNIKGYYSAINDEGILVRRLKGNKNAENIMPKAWKIAKLISNFPYIESVCISGSLSKGYFDEKSDIDFFIITKKNRIWIARTLLILYKKIFLLNSKKYFCVNYFMSSGYLKIDEENRFTATEIATLIPLYGETTFNRFIQENKWVYSFFPNINRREENIKTSCKSVLPKIIENLLDSKFGNCIELFFMKITIKKWNNKFNHLSKEDFELAFKSSENISKHHPSNFQKKVLSKLNEKYIEIEKIHNIKLTQEYA